MNIELTDITMILKGNFGDIFMLNLKSADKY